MPPILVRLNLPGFSSPEPFRLASAPPSMTGLACAVLEEIGGFSKEELDGVRNNLDRVPLTLLGELCAGQLVELASDAELGVFLATAQSPRGPAIIEVRPRDTGGPSYDEGRPAELTSPGSTTAPSSSPTHASSSIKESLSQPGTAIEPPPHTPHGQTTQMAHGPSVHHSSPVQHSPPAHAAPVQHVGHSGSHKPQGQIKSEPHKPQGHEAHEVATTQWPEAMPEVGAGDAGGGGRGHRTVPSGDLASQPCDSTEHQDRSSQWAAPARQERPKTPVHDAQPRRTKPQSRGGSRASTPPCERRMPWDGDAQRHRGRGDATAQGQPPAVPSQSQANERQPSREAPAYVRLYHEKDERRRRLEEARMRKIEQEEEDIRIAARRALGRAPSPGRAASPGRASSPAAGPRGSGSGTRTPPRTRPPLPERPSSASSWGRRPGPDSAAEPQRAPSQSSAYAQRGESSGPGQRGRHEAESSGHAHRGRHEVDASGHAHRRHQESEAQTAAVGHGQLPSPSRSPAMSGAPDASSIASDGAHGLQSVPSMGTLIGEDSLCGDMVGDVAVGGGQRADDMQNLRETVRAQQHRIEFLETRHQQALRELRKSREELATSQQQRLKEANKNLELEQLISEMQAMPFDSVAHDHGRWQDWLRRSRRILESEC